MLQRGLTPLHDSCLAGNIRATHMLLALGADITTQTKVAQNLVLKKIS